MKFLVDAQLPKSLSDFLTKRGYDSIHSLELPNKNRSSDQEIAEIANKQSRAVITKDADFLESFIIKSEPQKLIIIRTGNINNRNLMKLLGDNLDVIVEMLSRSNLVQVSEIEITEHD